MNIEKNRWKILMVERIDSGKIYEKNGWRRVIWLITWVDWYCIGGIVEASGTWNKTANIENSCLM